MTSCQFELLADLMTERDTDYSQSEIEMFDFFCFYAAHTLHISQITDKSPYSLLLEPTCVMSPLLTGSSPLNLSQNYKKLFHFT